jgi:hypothetical protein
VESRIIAAAAYQFFVVTRLVGSIVEPRRIAAIAYHFFLTYQASWEHCRVEDNCCCSVAVIV